MHHNETEKQRLFYEQVAACYDAACAFDCNDEHFIAAAILCGLIEHFRFGSVLDVGCGTGRALLYLRGRYPELHLHGVEPVAGLRARAVEKGFPAACIHEGDACSLVFPDSSFDCVMAFGVLHHISRPEAAIREMKRVARKAVYISDHNIYGMGNCLTRFIKQAFRDLGLRLLLKKMMTRNVGYHETTWDGIFYPFSLIDHLKAIRDERGQFLTFSTKSGVANLYRKASHIAVFATNDDAV